MNVLTDTEMRKTDNLTLLTIPEVQARLKIGRSTVYALLDSGHLRGVKLGNSRRVLVRDLQNYVDSL